jgi:predicted transcriptional regulator
LACAALKDFKDYVNPVFDIEFRKNASSNKFSKELRKDKLNCCALNVDSTRSGDESENSETKAYGK